jgi:hypothetical protein
VVCGHHVCAREAWILVPGGDHGLAQPGRAVLAAVQHNGCRLLRCGLGRGHESLRNSGNLQHRPRVAVYQPGVHIGPQGCRRGHFHGWQKAVDGQCLHRTPVALGEMGMPLPARP